MPDSALAGIQEALFSQEHSSPENKTQYLLQSVLPFLTSFKASLQEQALQNVTVLALPG